VTDRSSPERFSFQTFDRDSAEEWLEEFGSRTRMDITFLRDLAEAIFDFVPRELLNSDEPPE
jgi:hypothetical protein